MTSNLAALVAHKYMNWNQAAGYADYRCHFSEHNMVKYLTFCVRKGLGLT